LRFNPRQSAEEIEEDSSVGREDSEERAKHDAKKQHEQEKRSRLMHGIQHLKIKIPQQNTEDEERPQEEAGQVGQLGQADAIDGANQSANGLGMGVMTGEPMELAFDVIKKKDEPKYDREKPKPTTTIATVRARQRAEKGRKSKKEKTKTMDTKKKTRKRKAGNPLRVDTGRNPGKYTGVIASHRATQPSMQYSRQTRTTPNYLTLASMRSGPPAIMSSPRALESEANRAEMAGTMPTQPVTPSTPTTQTTSRIAHAPRGSAEHREATKGPKRMHAPRKPDTPMGAGHSKAHDLAMGGASPFAPLLAKSMTIRDKQEYRRLIQKLEKLLRGLTRKADASLDPAPDGPTPNAAPRMTSAPTGATETDPDDDPTLWGTHAYGLYTRRGGL
jgi:hypothetical protein